MTDPNQTLGSTAARRRSGTHKMAAINLYADRKAEVAATTPARVGFVRQGVRLIGGGAILVATGFLVRFAADHAVPWWAWFLTAIVGIFAAMYAAAPIFTAALVQWGIGAYKDFRKVPVPPAGPPASP